jgi:uncharacterized protein (DUF1330 family)
MTCAYIIVDMQISNLEQYKQYMAAAPAAVAAAGGEYLVRGGKFEALEGDWTPARVAMLKFPSSTVPRRFTMLSCTPPPAPSVPVLPSFSTWCWWKAFKAFKALA